MANKLSKVTGNAAGAFYVDDSCIDCDLCRSNVPEFFSRQDDSGYSYVFRQPVTAAEIAAASEALDSCPSNSIGNDGG